MRAGVPQFLESYISLHLPTSPCISSSWRAWASTRRTSSSGPTARPSRRAKPTSTLPLPLPLALTLTLTLTKGVKRGSKAKGQRGRQGGGSSGQGGGCRGLRVRLSAAAPGAEAADTLMLGGVGGGGMGGGMGGGGGGEYWQLRAKPGLWRVALRSDQYELTLTLTLTQP